MLYERWRQIARECPDELALLDLASGRRWTFNELAIEAEREGQRAEKPAGQPNSGVHSPFQLPRGHSPEFILTVLRSWRKNQIVCPLEPDQPVPALANLPSGLVHLKTTSATTGASRFVAFTGEQLAADADNIVATMGLRRDWPNLGVISLAHSYGFSNLVLPLLLHGVPLILVEGVMPETVRRAAQNVDAVTLPAVPALWRAWHDADSIPTNVRLAISAGAPLPLALEAEVFARHGLKIHNFYGASECGGIAFDNSAAPRADAACVGAPMRNVSLTVAEDGCLEVRSRAVAETYWPQSDANLGGGCFHTSDLAENSGEQVFLRGRASDQINVAGRKVSPETIERALLKHPQVLECLIFGVPSRDAERTEEIVAVVVSREGEPVLRQFVSETLPAWQAPRHWWFVDALGTNLRGKVSRSEWRERWFLSKDETK